MARTCRAALVACALLAIALPPAASAAGFTGKQGPAGFVSQFAASGDTWVAVVEGSPLQAFVSRDGAASWQAVPINGANAPQDAGGLSVGPDGAFYLTVQDQDGLALERMARDGTSFERLPAVLPAGSGAYA